MPPADVRVWAQTDSSRSRLKWLTAVVLVSGMLDATAVINTANFGIGVYIVAGVVACAMLARLSSKGAQLQPIVATGVLKLTLLCIALLWMLLAIQLWNQIGSPPTLFTQTALRTILLGHLIVCGILISTLNDRGFVYRTATWFLGVYLMYGLYDFAAQVLHLPRFLEFLRNSHSFAISLAEGNQGWIHLPRLSSISAEPSDTAIPSAFAAYLGWKMRGIRRVAYLALVGLFVIGTFARTVWASIGGSLALVTVLWLVSAIDAKRRSSVSGSILLAAAVCLPLIAIFVPFILSSNAPTDVSTLERLDSAKAGIWLFTDRPLFGGGFYGWRGEPARFEDLFHGSAYAFSVIHSGVAVYLSALGIFGLAIVYLPIIILMRSNRLSQLGKAWWVSVYCVTLIGGDYLALPSTWTAIAVAAFA